MNRIEASMKEGIWVYHEQDGGPIPTVVVAFYQRFNAERGSADASDWGAARFGMYLLENIEEVEELLALEVAYQPPEPPRPMDSEYAECAARALRRYGDGFEAN